MINSIELSGEIYADNFYDALKMSLEEIASKGYKVVDRLNVRCTKKIINIYGEVSHRAEFSYTAVVEVVK